MVQFTNAVAGTGVENWVAGSDMIAFSRGNKGFYGAGNVNGEFDTGLPDGYYLVLFILMIDRLIFPR